MNTQHTPVACCPVCGARSDGSTPFCTRCGTPLSSAHQQSSTHICKGCGAPLEPQVKFCNRCGTAVNASQASVPYQQNSLAADQHANRKTTSQHGYQGSYGQSLPAQDDTTVLQGYQGSYGQINPVRQGTQGYQGSYGQAASNANDTTVLQGYQGSYGQNVHSGQSGTKDTTASQDGSPWQQSGYQQSSLHPSGFQQSGFQQVKTQDQTDPGSQETTLLTSMPEGYGQSSSSGSTKKEKKEKKAAPAAGGKKKDSKLLLVLAIVAALAALAVVLFFVVHIWSKPECGKVTKCVLCGKTKGDALTHDWKPADCVTPKTCLRCGQTQGAALGHDWTGATRTQPAVCALCGSKDGEPLLPKLWGVSLVSGGSGYLGSGKHESDGKRILLSFPDAARFPQAEISFTNASGKSVTNAFVVEWVDSAASIQAIEGLSEGVYNINFQLNDAGAMLTVCYGYPEDIYPSNSEIFWMDAAWKNYVTDSYLTVSNGKICTVSDMSKATRFGSEGEMFGVKNGTLVVKPTVYFETRSFLRGQMDNLAAFYYDGYYIACDDQGNVFLTKELTDACYWIMAR